MMRHHSKGGGRQRGFTLIEIIVAIAIVGVLGSVAVLGVGGFLSRAESGGFELDRRLLQAATDAWRTDIAQRASNPYPTLTGSKGAITNCAESGVETNGVDVGTIQANCHIIKVSLLSSTYLKGTDTIVSFAYSTSSVTGATNSPPGSYVWYIDANGLVQGRRWSDNNSDGKIAASEIASSDGFVTGAYP